MFLGASPDGTVIAASVIDTSCTPSVGGLRLDLPATLNVFNIPWAMCGEPSGAGTKHAIPYVPAVSSVSTVVFCFGASTPGVPDTLGSDAEIFSNAALSCDESAFLN